MDAVALCLAWELNKTAKDLEEHLDNVKRASIVGSIVSIAGGGVGIVGALAAPFTMGLSPLVVSFVGIGVGLAGNTTLIGSRLVGDIITKQKLKLMEEHWELIQLIYKQEKGAQQRPAITEALLDGPTGNKREAIGAIVMSGTNVVDSLVHIGAKICDIIRVSIDLHKKNDCSVSEYYSNISKELIKLSRMSMSRGNVSKHMNSVSTSVYS